MSNTSIELNAKLHDTNDEPLKDITLHQLSVGNIVLLLLILTLKVLLFMGSITQQITLLVFMPT